MATTAEPAVVWRILLVDDEDLLVRAVRRLLVGAPQFEICSACDGETALVAFETEPPFDVLLTDIQLPDISGTALAQRFRALKPDLKVVFMSGDVPPDIDPEATRLMKPFLRKDLLQALEDALGNDKA